MLMSTMSNFEPRSPTARRKGDLVKFDFEHAYLQQGLINGPYCYCACVILSCYEFAGNNMQTTMDFDSILLDFLQLRGQERM